MTQENILDQEYLHDDSVNYAKVWQRVLALFIDVVLLWILSSILSHFVFATYTSVVVSFISLLYKPGLEYFYGATIGKMALQIKVVDANLEPPTVTQVILRNIFQILNQIIGTLMVSSPSVYRDLLSDLPFTVNLFFFNYLWFAALMLIDFGFLMINRKNQSLHDLMAQTLVVRKG
ncbi:MAG TPA: RDD family protein [Cytophagales bacterium]|nr:RDD family protein [Cytophagales bacterium]